MHHYNKHRSQSSLNTHLSRPVPQLYILKHKYSWLCSLIAPKTFFIALYVATIAFWVLMGMACGGKVSGSCPIGILQAFSTFAPHGRRDLREAYQFNRWDTYQPPRWIILVFSWYSVTSAAMGLYALRQAHQFVRYGRYVNGRATLHLYPPYLLIPSLIGYAFVCFLLVFWTYFVLEHQLPDLHRSVDFKSVVSFGILTILPLITVWAAFLYIFYGLVRCVSYIRALCQDWFKPSLPQHSTSVSFNQFGNNDNPLTSRFGSIRRSLHHKPSNHSRRSKIARGDELAAIGIKEPLNKPMNESNISNLSVKSQKLESIIEEDE